MPSLVTVAIVSEKMAMALPKKVCPSVCPNLNVELFSKTIQATVTKFGTKVLCDNALQNICDMVSFTQVQDKKVQGHFSWKSLKLQFPNLA